MNQHSEKDRLREKYLVNEQIKADRILLITESGEKLGEMSRNEALTQAEISGLDLVKIGEQGTVVIAKLMDFGKHLYSKKKQQNEAKKKQKTIQIKEIKMRPNIEDQDYMVKLNHAIKFLQEGKRVKFTLQFRGREMITMNDIGSAFFDRIHKDLETRELGTLISEKEQRGRPFWSKIYYIKGN